MLCSKNSCTGCLSCQNICPKNAIQVITDKQGFWQPQIDNEKCINCGLCHKSCPVYFKPHNEENLTEIYACWHKNPQKRQQAASGGLFTALMLQALSQNFYVCGSTLTDDLKSKHIIINKIEDYPLLIGSKYVQSFIGTTYKDIRKLLLQGEKVLFSGTPCQVAGLYAFLKKRYEGQLFTVDLLCHGVPSPQIFKDYLNHLKSKHNANVIDFKFREKPGWRRYQVIAKFDDNKKDISYKDTNEYIKGFLKGNFLRSSCYNCAYTNLDRVSDLTIGDFWNYFSDNVNSEDIDDDKGISMLLINTQNGKSLFTKAKEDLIYFAKDFQKSIEKSPRLHKPTKKPETYEQFWQDYAQHDFSYMLKNYF